MKGERTMDFMSLHIIKMKELAEYRKFKKKADILANVISFLLLAFVGFVWYLRYRFGV